MFIMTGSGAGMGGSEEVRGWGVDEGFRGI